MADKTSAAAADARAKQRIITHMNKDHQDSLIRYLEHYCHLSSAAARHAQLIDITFDHLAISTSTHSVHIVPIHPAMTSWSDARPRVVAMDAEAVAGLQRSPITVRTYVKPTGFMALVVVMVLLTLMVFSRRANFHPGSLVYDNLLVHAPAFARWCLWMRPVVLGLIGGCHAAETVYMHVNRLRRHTVATFGGLWWIWILSTVVEGYGAFVRFDGIVEEEQRTKANAKH
jgi:hypothetical protein